MNEIFIFGAKYLYILVLIIALADFLRQSKNTKIRMIALAIIALPLTYVVSKILGYFYYDPRPFVQNHFLPLIPHDPDNGFPSDHAILVGAISSVWFYFNKRLSFILWVIAILVGVSRIAVGIHHPVDIIGGFIIAILCTVISQKINQIKLFKKIKGGKPLSNI